MATGILKRTWQHWRRADLDPLAAMLAYYAVLAFAPMVIVVMFAAGLLWGDGEALVRVVAAVREASNAELARRLESLLGDARSPWSGLVAVAMALLALIFGASRALLRLGRTADQLAGTAPPRTRTWQETLRALSLTAVATATVFGIVIAGTLLSGVIAALVRAGLLNGGAPFGGVLTSFLLATGGTAILYRRLPAARPAWSSVWPGAVLCGSAWIALVELSTLYLRLGAAAPTVALVGSIVVLLIAAWAMAQVFLFGMIFNIEAVRQVPDTAADTDSDQGAAPT
jgi:membrane protein